MQGLQRKWHSINRELCRWWGCPDPFRVITRHAVWILGVTDTWDSRMVGPRVFVSRGGVSMASRRLGVDYWGGGVKAWKVGCDSSRGHSLRDDVSPKSKKTLTKQTSMLQHHLIIISDCFRAGMVSSQRLLSETMIHAQVEGKSPRNIFCGSALHSGITCGTQHQVSIWGTEYRINPALLVSSNP
jgi:hypothetical protein